MIYEWSYTKTPCTSMESWQKSEEMKGQLTDKEWQAAKMFLITIKSESGKLKGRELLLWKWKVYSTTSACRRFSERFVHRNSQMLDLCQRKQNLQKTHQVHFFGSNILTKLGRGLGKMSVVKVARREQAAMWITGTEVKVSEDRR